MTVEGLAYDPTCYLEPTEGETPHHTIMSTPPKPTSLDLINMTVVNTPMPQASSTVQRKGTLQSRMTNKDFQGSRYRLDKDTSHTSNSSLGILDNISSLLGDASDVEDKQRPSFHKIDIERELARRLLQKCSEPRITSIRQETNKENDFNIQNTNSNNCVNRSAYYEQANNHRSSMAQRPSDKAQSVVFELDEIAARSSSLSKSPDKSALFQGTTSSGGISFDTTAQELMAQFQNEEFHPASEMASQMLADEASWQENCSYGVPVATNAEKEYLDLSCFSGIIGELDLSIESCAGRKVSVGEFFQRKCGNIGVLSVNDGERPSFGFSINSPTKKDKRMALVDSTIMTEASSVHKENEPVSSENITINNIEEHNIMSLSSIAQALQDIDNGTPRRLVDQLIMATKKKKQPQLAENLFPGETFTMLPSSRNSMPVTPLKEGLRAENEEFPSSAAKLSLDSKTFHELSNSKNKLSKMMSFRRDLNIKTNESVYMTNEIPQKDTSNIPLFRKDALSFHEEKPSPSVKTMLQNSQINDESFILYQSLSKNRKMENTSQSQSLEKKDVIKQENISYDSKDPTMDFSASRVDSDVIVIRSAEELCSCIVGIPRTTNIELTNKADRWIICCLSLHQIQGDKQTIIFRLPKDIILVKPHASQTVQVNVEILKVCAPVIVVLNIASSDMVTRSEWSQKHILCFEPEELKITVNTHSQKCELDFQCIANNCTATLPITLESKNSIDLPMRLSIVQNEPKIFSFDINETPLNNDQNIRQTLLKTMGQLDLNLLCKGHTLSHNESDLARKQLLKFDGKLIIQVQKEESDPLTIKEIPLVVQVGICRIDIVDTEKTLLIPKKQSKALNVLNSGSVPTPVAACIVEDEASTIALTDFSVRPDSLFLKRNEIGTFTITYKPLTLDTRNRIARIKVTAGNNVCYHAIVGEQSSESQNEILRCETPQYLVPASSPTSPHSVASGRGISGRNSPGSTASGATVAGDKIPIRATHAVLVWNCVKAGKSEIKEFAIRNTSENKIRIQASISDNDKSFKFLRERQAAGTSIILSMQRMESRTLTVVYTPHRIGASSGKITLRHYEVHGSNNESRPSKAIFLNGYGGCGKVEISEAFKDTSGKMWLSLGTLNSEGSLKAKIRLQNTGDLCSYAKIKLTPKAVYPAMVSSWQVEPTELVLNPNEIQWVMLEFRPRKEDLALLKRADVSHVGTITVTHGDEPTRWRIRRLYNKMKETGELRGSENEAFRNVVYPICRAFPGEQLLPDLTIVRDSIQNLGDLCRGVQQHEIMLTMEVCADETLSILHDEADDSQMFYSLCSDNSHVYEPCGDSFLPSQTMGFHEPALHHHDFEDQISVKPSVVTLVPPLKTEVTVTISTSSKVAEPFETMLSNTDLLTVLPAEGMIPAARGFPLKIQCGRRVDHSFEALLEICTENSKQEVLIKVSASSQ